MDDEEEYQFTVEYQAATYQGRRTVWATDEEAAIAKIQRQGLEASQHRAEIAEIAKSLDCSRAEVARQAGDIAKMAELVDEVGKESVADVAEAMRQRDAARAEVERLKERLAMMQHGEAEALKMMAAEKKRADVLAEGIAAYRELVLGGDYVRCGCEDWERKHGHEVSK